LLGALDVEGGLKMRVDAEGRKLFVKLLRAKATLLERESEQWAIDYKIEERVTDEMDAAAEHLMDAAHFLESEGAAPK
jgi:hypothetical protein